MCFLKHQEGQGFVKELGSEIWTSLKSCISALIRCAESSEKREKKNTAPEAELAHGRRVLSLGHAECWFVAEPDQGQNLPYNHTP